MTAAPANATPSPTSSGCGSRSRRTNAAATAIMIGADVDEHRRRTGVDQPLTRIERDVVAAEPEHAAYDDRCASRDAREARRAHGNEHRQRDEPDDQAPQRERRGA